MKKRMQELAAGVFEYEGPRIKLSNQSLELSVTEGERLKGTFSIESENEILMKGIIYSNNPRMVLTEPQFSGINAVLEYEFNTEGLVDGDIQKGEFFIVSNKNEYTLPFVVQISRELFVYEGEEVDSLQKFTSLAKKDYRKAYALFASDSFRTVIMNERESVVFAAKLLAYEGAPMSNMEEFLVTAAGKERTEISCDFTDLFYDGLTEDIRETINVIKSSFGFIEVLVSTDAPFVLLKKSCYSVDDFIGNECRIPFYVSTHNLHAGLNYGSVSISTGLQTFTYKITVKNPYEAVGKDKFHDDIRHTRYDLCKSYIDYRCSKITSALWAQETLVKLDHMLGISPDNNFLWLCKALTLIMSNRIQEAQWILDKTKKFIDSKTDDNFAFYLYITTFLNTERSHVKKVSQKISEIYKYSDREDFLFWLLIHIGEEFENSRIRKYRAIKERFIDGCASPFFYVEAYGLLKEYPDLLTEAGSFEEKLFLWADKQEILDRELVFRLAEILNSSNSYRKFFPRILKKVYDETEDNEVLTAYCKHVILGNAYDASDYPYFSLAVENELRIEGLYEAFIVCASQKGEIVFPKVVQYYFQFKNKLSYKYKAIVYAGIVKNKAEQASLYLKCQTEMESFCLEQIYAGHLDENLAVIYEDFLKDITVTRELARGFAPLLYIHKLSTDNRDVRRVIVTHKQLNKTFTYQIMGGLAFFPIYTKDHYIAFEDDYGRRYMASVDFDLQVLLRGDYLTKKFIDKAPEQMSYLIHYFDMRWSHNPGNIDFSENELQYLDILLSSDVVSTEYKAVLRPQIIDFYYRTERVELLDEYLKSLDFKGLDQQIRLLGVELLISRGFYRKAYEVIVSYGCTQIAPSLMLHLCKCLIEETSFEADDYLIGLCSQAFRRGKYNEELLDYLCRYMYGSTRELYELWIAARDFKVKTFALEERLLVQMLYSEKWLPRSEEILTSYIEEGGKKLVLDAYLSYFAYQYFVREAEPNHLVMDQLLGMAKAKQRLNKCQVFALFKYLTESSSSEYKLMRELYHELLLKGYVFAFYEKLPNAVTVDMPRMGKKVLEYRSNPKSLVYLRYRKEGYGDDEANDFLSCQMEQMYEGIFVKEFTMFYGDSVQYYICEGDHKNQEIKLSGELNNMEIQQKLNRNRYEQINNMVISEQLGEHNQTEFIIKNYDEQLSLIKDNLNRM